MSQKRIKEHKEDSFAKKRKEIVSIANGGSDIESEESEDETNLGKKALMNRQYKQEEDKPEKVKNKQRVLVITSRGITYRFDLF
jgi:hypothetical protein